ncbi:putative ATPase WRNIP1-like [Apostichopus japonicus]|uniref:Putative ATPase WRNIP1-like n=1 Tax=Stichopus japonicus TaxID=307972 RepID=A0A2G8K3M7_STIJA|nr:putative ATPase WRNIP1-like [Apostichopus japonicus]
MEDESDAVTCPICSKELPLEKINSHIDICLRTSGQEMSKRQRSSSGDRDSGNQKRHKVTKESDNEENQPTHKQSSNHTVKRVNKPSSPFKDSHIKKGNSSADSSKSPISGKTSVQCDVEPGESSKTLGTRVLSSQSNRSRPLDSDEFRPLAERMRPKCMEDFIGQGDLFGTNRILKKLINTGQVSSLILCGPPGSGKTTLAGIIAKKIKELSNSRLVKLSATTSNVAEVKKVIAEAGNLQRMFKRKTILFMDEIHRFNKLQQDTFLPFIENGTITLLGATTENPSFSLNSALLSRCQVITLRKHSTEDLMLILECAAGRMGAVVLKEAESHCENDDAVKIEEDALSMLANFCDGDARSALNVLEMAIKSCKEGTSSSGTQGKEEEGEERNGELRGSVITTELIKDSLQRSHIQYDRTGDEHYNCISAIHKSMRASDENASLYWLGRMLIGGENPLYVARRLIEFASVDVGLADPSALVQAVSTYQACQFLGMPVCEFNLAQCVTYLARAPKSSEIAAAYGSVKMCIMEHQGPMPGVPLHLRNVSPQVLQRMA